MTTNPTNWTSELGARYELLEEAGRGGMGVVYKTRDRETGEVVALKILKPEIAADPVASERFINEVRLSRRITHKNVCRVYEFSRAGSTAYLSMEYVEGESLRVVLDRMGAVTLRKGLQIARQICAALVEAHSQGVIHRDLKPENVMLDRAGNVKVMDFGIARLLDASVTSTAGIIGTPAYMAPEQAEGRQIDERTDIYATGLILYEIFTGQTAFTGDTPITVALKQIRETAAAPRTIDASIPPDLDAVIMRCLEKDPARRFQSAADFDAAVAGLGSSDAHTTPLRGLPTDVLAPGSVLPPDHLRLGSGGQERGSHQPPAASAVRRNPGRTRLAVAAIAIAAIALGAAYLMIWRPRDQIPFTTFTLKNGLKVILSEDHSAPTVAVAVLYNVGWRDAPPGRSGLPHLFEHMMFGGSLNVGKGEHLSLVNAQGGSPNGGTALDHTQFWETLPANQLDLALFLEADRMRSLRLDEARLQTERGTVLAERQQRIDNAAYGRVQDAMFEAAFDLPGYKLANLGTADDLQAATLQQVSDFFRVYYAPNNAVIAVVGDFEPKAARAKIERYFEHIPAQPPPPVPDLAERPQTAERRVRIDDPFAPATRTYIGYKLPPGGSEDYEAIHVLATLLADGESSRLHRKLVTETESAAGAGFQIYRHAGPSFAMFVVVPAANRDEAAMKAFDEVVAQIRDQGVTGAEVERARNKIRLTDATALQSTAIRAIGLAEAELKFGGAGGLNRHAARLAAVTPDAVKQAAAGYFKPEQRTVVTVVPGGAPPPAAPQAAATSPAEHLNRAPVSRELLRVTMPRPKEIALDNGLAVQIAEDHRAPLVALRFDIRGAGSLSDPADMPGLAMTTAAMLRQGTATRTSAEIAEQLATWGVSLGVVTGPDPAVTTIQALGLSETFDRWFPLVSEIVQQPSFAADTLSLMKRRLAAEWISRQSQPSVRAADTYVRAVYGAATGPLVTTDSFAATTSDRLRAWHREHYVPQNTTLSIAGALDGGDAERLARQALSGWARTSRGEPLPAMPASPARRVHVVDRAGSVQTSMVVGGAAVDRVHPDYLPLVVANRVLGGSAASRLFVKLRDERGLTYGAFSQVPAFKHGGDWRAYGDLGGPRTVEAVEGFLAELHRVATEEIPAAEFDAAKHSIVASFALGLEQLAQVVSSMATRRNYGLSSDYWDRYPERIMAVSPADARRAAAIYLDPARLQIVAVGDAATIAPLLSTHGPVTVYGADGKAKQ